MLRSLATVIVSAAALVLVHAGPLSGQGRGLDPGTGFEAVPRMGIGYVTNAPNIFLGVGLYGIVDVLGGLGLYVDGKMTRSSPADEPDFEPGLALSDVDHLEIRDSEYDWYSVNAAVVRPLTPELMVYLGGGYTSEEAYHRYYADHQRELGNFGYFWRHAAEESGGRLNLLGGAFFRMGRHMAFQFGVESAPAGFTVGLSYSLPLR